MQKKLIAAAVAGLIAAPVFAQTNVTISGNFRAGWESYKLGGCATGWSCNNESRVSDQSSGLRFNVVEDLGGGLKAWGQLDYRGALDLGGLANSGNSGVGFMHDSWGKFTIGRWDMHYDESARLLGASRAGSLQTMLHNGLLSQVAGVTIASGTRTPNVLMWDSPNWNGFTGRLAYSSGWQGGEGSGAHLVGAKDAGGGSAWTGAIRYNNGPWAAGYSYWHGNQENRTLATTDQRGHRANLGYSFAMGLKIGLGLDRSSLKVNTGVPGTSGTARRTAWYVPVTYAWGPHAVYFQYAHAGDTSNTVGDTGANAWSLGYDYAFSKRTSAGIFYTKLSNKNAGTNQLFAIGAAGSTAAIAGEDPRQIYIGMNHTF